MCRFGILKLLQVQSFTGLESKGRVQQLCGLLLVGIVEMRSGLIFQYICSFHFVCKCERVLLFPFIFNTTVEICCHLVLLQDLEAQS